MIAPPPAPAPALAPLLASLYVAAGGAAGAVLRYQTGRAITGIMGAGAGGGFPFATLAVNALGSALMGLLAGWLALRAPGGAGEPVRLLLGVGVLGGFTTFSAFSLELVELAERGQLVMAGGYALASLALGAAGLVLGLAVMRGVA